MTAISRDEHGDQLPNHRKTSVPFYRAYPAVARRTKQQCERRRMAVRQGFEPWVELLGPTTV